MYYLGWGDNSANKVLFGKHENLSLIPQAHIKVSCMLAHMCHPSTEMGLTDPARLICLTSTRLVRIHVLKTKIDSS